jgi:hypothetical protein
VKINTSTISGTISYPSGTSDLLIGDTGAWAPMNGYIADFRVINGTALYTNSTLTVPDLPFYEDVPNTILRLKMISDRYVDFSPYNSVINSNTATVTQTYASGGAAGATNFTLSSIVGVSGGMSIRGTGIPAGTYVTNIIGGTVIQINNPLTVQAAGTYTFNAGAISSFHPFKPDGYYSVYTGESFYPQTTNIIDQTADFTLEFWVNIATAPTGNYVYLFNTTDSSGGSPQINSYNIGMNTNKTIFVERWSSTTATTTILTSSALSLINNWYHVAVVRIGSATNNLKIYVNGALNVQTTATDFCTVPATTNSVIFNNGGTGSSWAGYISNLRYTNGIGIYTGAFTVPGNPLKKIQPSGTNIAAVSSYSSVSLLTCHHINLPLSYYRLHQINLR